MIRIGQLKISAKIINQFKKDNEKEKQMVLDRITKKYHIRYEDIKKIEIMKKSIDARKKEDLKYVYTVELTLEQEKKYLNRIKDKNVMRAERKKSEYAVTGTNMLKYRPIVVGSGPAGLFCSYFLALEGYQPILLERGKPVEERRKMVDKFWQEGKLDTECNVQFGEGGAGTFSDGKLNTLVKDTAGRSKKVLEVLTEHGAPEEILYLNKPHIGTDYLSKTVKNIREHIIRLGGEVRFSSKVTDIQLEDGGVKGVFVNEKEFIPCEVLVLAIGHSARDTFEMLYEKKAAMEQKAFAIGVRIEHPQDLIGKAQYGEDYREMPAADYKLTYQASNGRSVYSFCMCPGGFVVNSSSEQERLVVNGMSNFARNEKNANSALIVNIRPEDFESDEVLAGMEFQRKWESLAYKAGSGAIPIQLFGDFKKKEKSKTFASIEPVTKGNYQFANLWTCLPEYVCDTLIEGIEAFDQKIKGYGTEDAVLLGVETRTSSPIRILREKDTLKSCNIEGLYPCGEGAGYAGGITSAAMDGMKVFEAIIKEYQQLEKEHRELS